MRSSFLWEDNIIPRGDLNFSLGHAKSWGNHTHVYPLLDYFVQMLESNNLIDIPMVQFSPTWRNKRIRDAMLAK